MKKAQLLIVFCLVVVELFAQHRLGGVKLEDDKYLTIPFKSLTRSSEFGSKKSLREELIILPQSQGYVLACVGYSIAQALSIMRKLYFDFECPDKKPLEIFSASYLYNQLSKDLHCNSGIYMSDALDTLVSQGICPTNVFPNDTMACDVMPALKHRKIAADYKILKYKRIFKIKADYAGDSESVDLIKKQLVPSAIGAIDDGNPVIVVLMVTEDFLDCQGKRRWILPKDPKKTYAHAMVLIGYDDVRQEFEFLNSYGPEWGDGGFVHIGYDDFAQTARYGYVIYLDGANLNCAKR